MLVTSKHVETTSFPGPFGGPGNEVDVEIVAIFLKITIICYYFRVFVMSLVDIADENIFGFRFDNDDGHDNGDDIERTFWSQWRHTDDFNPTLPVIYVSCNAPMCIHPSVDAKMTQSLVNFLHQCLNVPLVRQHNVVCRHGFHAAVSSNATT